MNGGTNTSGRSERCQHDSNWFQDYLDGTLSRKESLDFFLHMRECAACEHQFEESKRIFQLLDSLPPVEIPDDFNEKVLSAVPYQGYKEMAHLRRERVPVFLEEDFLPTPVRSTTTRVAAGVLALLATTGLAMSWLPDLASIVVVVGLLPEALVRLQNGARRLALAVQKTQSL